MRFVNIKQHDMSDCGPTCLAIITKFYKGNVSIARLREEMGTNTTGTSLKGLISGAQSIGFKVDAMRCIQDETDNMDNIPLPCISHVIVDNDLLHYVVILKIEKDKIIISDPAQGIIKLSRDSFRKLETCKVSKKQYKWTGVLVVLSPTEEFGEKYQKPSKFLFLLEVLSSDKKICCFIIATSLLYTVINIGSAFYYKILIDKILPEYAFQSLVLVVEAFLLLTIAKVILNVLRINISLVLGKHINNKISMDFYSHLLKMQQKFFDNRRVGELVARFQDAAVIQDLLSKIVLTVFIDIIAVIVAGFILYYQNKEMFLGLMVMCFLYIIVAILFRKKYDTYSKNQLVNEAQTMSGILDFLNGIMTVKVYNAKSYAFEMVKKKFNSYLESMYKLGSLENLQYGLKSWIGFTGEIIILGMGVIFIFLNRLTLGELITFNALIIYFFDPIRNLIGMQAQLQTALVATERIQEIMDLDLEECTFTEGEEEIDLDILQKDICFDGVSFGYNPEKNVLHNFCLNIKAKSNVAIIGESGSGKSTITKLLMKLYKLENGYITIGEKNIDKIDTEWLRERIVYVSQETFLFSISIMDNLLLGNTNINEKDVFEVCKLVYIHEFIMELPLQYNTILEEGGSNLSTGQKQRLMIARAILKIPHILILDEATSNLNFDLEKNINNAIKQYLPNTTIIIVTHRTNIAKSCDMIYVLEKGVIREYGHHQELIDNGGIYCRLLGQ
ncbi:MAG: peptidase domain-containing ABC transporter [Muricomes sp.]